MSQNTPIILLAGRAGSGKDTVGAYLTEKYNAITLGQADPLKRFVKKVIGFTDQQLWGPSEYRNALAPQISREPSETTQLVEDIEARYEVTADRWIEDLMPRTDGLHRREARACLDVWLCSITGEIGAGNGLSPRKTLQTLGTEWGRDLDHDLWTNYAQRTAKTLLYGGQSYNRNDGLVPLKEGQSEPDYVVITDGRFRNEILTVRERGGVALLVDRPDLDTKAVETAGIAGHRSEKELGSVPRHFYTDVIDNSGTLDQLFYEVDLLMWVLYDAARSPA